MYTKTRQEVLKQLGVAREQGLTKEQVKISWQKYGANTFFRHKKESMLRRIFEASTEPMLLMLIAAAVITLFVNISRFIKGGEYNFLECLGIFVAIALSVVITIITEGKSEKAFEALNRINEDTLVKVLREGKVQLVAQREIVVGDILLIETGDKIVADGRILEANDLSVDESALTGESVPVSKDAAVVCPCETPVAERCNMVYSGCFVSGGNASFVVTAVGNETQFGKIAKELSSIEKTTTPLQEKLDKLGKLITVLGCSAAAAAFMIQIVQFIQHNEISLDTVSDAFITSIVLIVAAVPEGLPTIVAVSLALNIIKMTGEKALVKKMVACETIGCVNIICSDKTGTLTDNKMTVQQIYHDGRMIEANQIKEPLLIHNFCLNSNANILIEEGVERFIGNPTEGALLVAAKKAGYNYKQLRKQSRIIHTYPFSSQNKDMSTVVMESFGLTLYTKGNPEKILKLCKEREDVQYNKIMEMMEQYQRKGGRILAFAHKMLDKWEDDEQDQIEKDLEFDGFTVISDPLSKEVNEAILKCQAAGIEVMMLTGDNILTACSIANELHMLDDEHIAVEASQIENLSDEQLKEKLKKIKVIARSTPLLKLRIVKLLKQQGNVVAVTGDGINDAPAIKHADAGIAMGIAGTEVTKEASDIVLLDDSFMTIVKAVQWGRGIYENFKRFIMFQLTVNVSSVVVVIASILCGFETPFSALDLLWINIIMDGPPALTLGLEPIREDLLKRPPTKRSENILTKQMLVRIFVNGLFISAVFMLQHVTNFLGANPQQEKTVLFTLFVVFQLFNAFNCRELDNTSVFKYFFRNKLMLGIFLFVLILQFVITQIGGAVFETVPVDGLMWGKILLTGLSVTVLNEVIKTIKRKCA
ncbi:calcium-translocating P-type ATPase, PMCA-type [Eubacterium oxidoreducens]|uniref:calcium-translocating P-type ATPase, PMCA-type n=1 Tax=Eubacterium oxidoreducens TaxID=1732 RepID=UPI001FA784C4|nr:calcium-translocating P-type ATPase, PMCA-type [Eubacterium oxidoreducens]